MSLIPEIVSVVNEIYQKVILSQKEPATLILPVQENTLPNNDDFRIYMDHPRLPTPVDMTLAGNDVMAHYVGDFAYECQEQPNAGAFHLLNAAGNFAIGLKEWLSQSDVANEVKLEIVVSRTVDGFNYQSRTLLMGSMQAHVFLNPGDFFWLNYVQQEENDTAFIGAPTELLITRLSRNPFYTPQFPFIS
jgi:hypothetical protein